MAEHSKRETDIVSRHLGLAWQAFTPGPGLQDRVRARLTSSAAATMGLVSTGAALKTRPESTWASLQASSKLGASLIGAGLLALGVLAGYFIRDAQEPAPAARVAATPPAPPPAPSPLVSHTPSPAAPALETPVAPAPPAPRPARRRPVQPPVEAPASPAAGDAPAAVELSEELALLRRAERAVRNDNSALALALIGELEQRYPRSGLLEERRAIELLAHCSAGASDAAARAQRFLREHPRSVHAGRIAESCGDAGELSRGER